ncbi:MAG: acyl--CoA ligase [Actinomycetota bacterium]|nr:acyl--CoA ligase [Actinomycetota bacterium]
MAAGLERHEGGVMAVDLVPSRLRAAWVEAGYCPGRDLFRLFEEQASSRPAQAAVIDDASGIKYGELALAAKRLAVELVEAGVGPGEVVAVQLPNCWQACAVELAVAAVGAVCLPYPMKLGDRESRVLLTRSHAVAAVIAGDVGAHDHAGMLEEVRADLPRLRQVFVLGAPHGNFPELGAIPDPPDAPGEWSGPAIDPDGPARVLVTSGTESIPKMVLYSHNALAAGFGNRLATLDPTGLRALCLVPLSTGFGGIGVIGTLICHGGTLVVTAGFDPDRVLALVDRERPTHIFGVPTMLTDLLASPLLDRVDTSSVRVVAAGGAAIAPEIIEEVQQRFGCTFVNRYGTSDGVACQTSLDDPLDRIVSTVGRPDPAVCTIRIVDDEGDDQSPGREGEIWGRGPFSPLFYLNSPELDRRYRTEDGWIKTGDLGVVDEDGYLRVVGRAKDIIIRGGANISPAEIEELLHIHGGVRYAACVGMPDERLGERVCAVVVPIEDAQVPSLDELNRFLLARGLAKFKLPERLEVVAELPRNPVGKVNKEALRRRLESRWIH